MGSLQTTDSAFLDAIAAPVLVVRNGRVVVANIAICKILNCEKQEIIDRSLLDYVSPASHDDVLSVIQNGGDCYCLLITATGRHITVRMSANQLGDQCVITLKESTYGPEVTLSLSSWAVNGINAVIFVRDPYTRDFVYVSPAYERIYGLKLEDLRKDPSGYLKSVHPDDIDRVNATRNQYTSEWGDIEIEYRVVHPNGEVRWINVHSYTIYDKEGQPELVIGLAFDITDRKQIEAALRESERRYRIFAELSSDYAFIYNVQPDGSLERTWMSHAFEAVTGYSSDESLMRGGWRSLIHPDDYDGAVRIMQDLMRGEKYLEYESRIIRKDGMVRHMAHFSRSVYDPVQKRVTQIYGVARDITERKMMELNVRDSERRFRALAENSPDYVYIYDMQTNLKTYFNKSEFLGYAVEEFVKPSFIMSRVHPDDVDYMCEHWRRITREHVVSPAILEYRVQSANGVWEWVQARHTIFTWDVNSGPAQVLAVLTVITDHKQIQQNYYEQERLRLALHKEHELNDLKTRMMVRIAHEFRTPLALINTAAHLIQNHGHQMTSQDLSSRYEGIERQIQYLTRMLDNIAFVVSGEYEQLAFAPTPVDVERLCCELIEEALSLKGNNHRFGLHIEGHIRSVISDPMLLRLILGNLISNAIKYSPSGTLITITANYEPDQLLTFEVSDEGIGIVDGDRQRLFEPFFRGTNFDERPGLGLGLSIVQEAVELHGGTIEVVSKVDKGTTFIIKLPVTTRSAYFRD